MDKNSAILQFKSDEFIELITSYEEKSLTNSEKQKLVETITRVLIHSRITIDCLTNEQFLSLDKD